MALLLAAQPHFPLSTFVTSGSHFEKDYIFRAVVVQFVLSRPDSKYFALPRTYRLCSNYSTQMPNESRHRQYTNK